jgi:hypothetical protein
MEQAYIPDGENGERIEWRESTCPDLDGRSLRTATVAS